MFTPEAYTLQDNTIIDGQIITDGEFVVKAQYRGEGGGDGAGGSHHGTRTIVLSGRRRLLQIRAHVDVKKRAMQMPQS